MKLVFMGTPDFAVPTLKALVEKGHTVSAVFTQPDRPAGRGKNLKPSPVKVVAESLGLPIYQPEKVKTRESLELLKEISPDVIIVVAYGQILSREILELPPHGCINVHASLLPDWRGAAPIHWSIIEGNKVTGVTTMHMDEGLDTGDMLLKAECPISEDATTGEIHDQLAELGGKLLIETLEKLEKGELKSISQEGPTRYAVLLKREHEKIQWAKSAQDIHNQIRGLNPWPGAYSIFHGESVKIWKSKLIFDNISYTEKETGEIIGINPEGLVVKTGEGVLLITEVQPSGKKKMPARDFFLGRHAQVGERFENE